MCALFDLKDYPQIKLKIPGRGDKSEAAVNAVSRAVDYLYEDNVSRDGYIGKVKEIYREIFGQECTGYGCYFPQNQL